MPDPCILVSSVRLSPWANVLIVQSLLFVSLLLLITRVQRRRLERRAQVQALEAARQRWVLESALQVQEAEHRRMARDLHDDVGTTLSALKNLVYGLRHEPDVAAANEIAHVLNDVIQRVRALSGQLLPATLEKFGLVRALQALATQLNTLSPSTNVRFEYTAPAAAENAPPRLMPPGAELMLYRVAQELTGNALKHAAAQNLVVQLRVASTTLELVVTDDGHGFDYAAVRHGTAPDQPAGLGLFSLESRVRTLHGDLQIESAPGRGTQARVTVPVG